MTTTISDAINIKAPAARAYDQWRSRDEFTRIVDRLRQAWWLQEARFHWQDEEMQANVEWDDAPGITDEIPDRFLAWQDNERANHTATAEFSPIGDAESRVTVEVTFDPKTPLETRPADANEAMYAQLHKELEDFKSALELPPASGSES